jgi:hypothetical protein
LAGTTKSEFRADCASLHPGYDGPNQKRLGERP